jgi:formate-dependent nitrite reductase cytochrome c552 subunit
MEESDAWLASPHVTVAPEAMGDPNGASCVDCHGPYVKDHPAAGTIRLSVDSAQCESCHTDTYAQWQHTQHAGEGVQCISCHSPHSQELRLTDETLCQSCHREAIADPLHTAHWDGDVSCTNCHMNGAAMSTAFAATEVNLALVAPTHDFTAISPESCLECHRETVGKGLDGDAVARNTAQRSSLVAEPNPQSSQRLAARMASVSIANLGLGLGFGSIFGIVFMLAAARFLSGRDS